MGSKAKNEKLKQVSSILTKCGRFLKTQIFAIAALCISGYLFVDNTFMTDINVYVGRQARLWVVIDSTADPIHRPAVFLTLTFVNDGGRLGIVTDTRFFATFRHSNRPDKTEVPFESIREIKNILTAEKEESEQEGIAAVPVLGKSTDIKKYIYVPPDGFVWDTTSTGFEMVFDLQIKQGDKWVPARAYSVSSNNGVWRDLYRGDRDSVSGEVVEVLQVHD